MLLEEKIKIGLVNTQKIYKEGLRVLFNKYQNIEVVGEAQTDGQFLKFLLQKKPNIILVDLCKPGTGCIAAILNVIKNYPEIKVIILVSERDDEMLVDFLQAGVQGFAAKEDDNEIIKTIEEVTKGNTYYSKTIEAELEVIQASVTKSGSVKKMITKTEEKIICCICNEMTNKEISEQLFVSVRTVEGYRLKILQKVRAKSTAGIVIYAIQNGIVKLNSKRKSEVRYHSS